MGKGMRSKIKRKHRAEFRQTIGEEAAQANMAIVQAKLQECINKGSMNSFDRLSKVMNGPAATSNDNEDMEDDSKMPAIDAVDTTSGKMDIVEGKNPDKTPVKAGSRKKKKHLLPNVAGQPGAKLARKKVIKAKRRGQFKNGVKLAAKRKTRAPRKKPMCSF